MREGVHRGFVVCSGAERVVLAGKPAVQWSREESWGGATKSMCPRKNISRRQRLFHFLIENEFNISSIQTNMNLEGAWRTDC